MPVAARFSDEFIRSMLEDDVDRPLEDWLKKAQSKVSDRLRDAEFPSLEELDRVDNVEAGIMDIVEYLADDADDYRHGAAVFSQRPGEEARTVVAELRDLAAWADARLAEAQELVATTRRLMDRYLREAAGTDELLHYAANEFQIFVTKETDGGDPPFGENADNTARAAAIDAAARADDGVGARFAERFTTLAERLRKAAATTYVGEQALVEAMRRQAAAVEALCADPDSFVAKMLTTGSWRCFMAMNRCVLAEDQARRRQLQRQAIN
uniref:Uncharacterized protein n=1 Tax=Avena sativa TaxID=4498 RepID=A0ACD5TM56_AVESA